MTFPFNDVYEAVAKMVLDAGLPADGSDLMPIVALALAVDGKAVGLAPLPGAETFFTSPAGKAHLGQFIRETVAKDSLVEGGDHAVVAVFEMYFRAVIAKEGQTASDIRKENAGPLSEDPESEVAVMIQISHRGGVKMGMLPIRAGRRIEYAPLMEGYESEGGRLSLNPAPEDLPPGHTRH